MRIINVQIEEFLTNCQIKHLSAKTIKSYNQSLLLMADYLEFKHNITDATQVKAIHINAYIGYLQERGKYTIKVETEQIQPNYPERRTDYKRQISKTTINNYIRNMRVFFNYLLDFDYINKSPMSKIRQLKNPRQPLEFITDAEFASLIRYMDMSQYHEYRDKIILQLLLDTGMRIGECLNILTKDINFVYNSITLPWENTKGKKTRTVFFSDEMRKILRLWLKHKDKFNSSEYLFPSVGGNILSVNAFERNVRQYAERVGITGLTPKTLRNNFAKRFLLNGGDIFTLSKILGHSSVEVTEQAYLDLTDEDLRRQYQKFSPIANMKK